MRTMRTGRAVLVLGVSLLAGPAWGQLAPDQAALLVLNSARKAYNARQYDFAAARFREFLSKYGGHAQAPAARYGLALALIEGPRDYAAAADQLQPLVNDATFPEHTLALYYLGLARRGQGLQDLAQHRPEANPRFEEAARFFGTAAKAFASRAKAPAKGAGELPLPWEWAARARCDQAEMLLRLGKAREARDATAPFVKDKVLARSRYRGQGRYFHGYACFLLRDFREARHSLDQAGALANPLEANHARFLLARIRHLRGELAAAWEGYQEVLTGYARLQKEAAEALNHPDQLKGDPGAKARAEALAKGPPPGHVARAALYRGGLLYDAGRFAEARDFFADFARQHPGSPLLPEARLFEGLCLAALKQPAEAVKTLQPVADQQPRLADQALLGIARVQIAQADPKKPGALDPALNTLRQAAQKAQQQEGQDREARGRRGDILLTLAGVQERAGQFREAAATCTGVLNEKLLPGREAEILLRQGAALHRAGDYAGCDQACQRFLREHPKSEHLPAVLLCSAANAASQALAAAQNPSLPDRVNTLARLNAEAVKRYREVLDRYPKSAHANRARFGLGLLFYQQGKSDDARKVLEEISPADRKGDMAQAGYLLADCLLHAALPAGQGRGGSGDRTKLLRTAAGLFDAFLTAQPDAPQAPDPLLKLGLCQQHLADLAAGARERGAALAAARGAYERLLMQFPGHALEPRAVFERARCLARAGDRKGASEELRRFARDPLQKSAVAPAAVCELARLLVKSDRAAEGAQVLEDYRRQQEPTLRQDPARSAWVVRLQYQQALALRDAGQLATAAQLLDGLTRQFPDRPEAPEAALLRGQCLKEEALRQVRAARRRLAAPGLQPPEQAAARAQMDAGYNALQGAVQYLTAQADQLKPKPPAREVRARMLYEAAWGYRQLARPEVEAANHPAGKPGSPAGVKLQPSEEKARALYQALIDDQAFAGLPLATDARLELAELYAGRGNPEAGIKLLRQFLDQEPPAEVADQVHVCLGTCLAARNDMKAALAQFDRVARNPRSPLAGQAQYRAAECLTARGDYAGAAARLAVFRDQQPFRKWPGLADRALLLRGQVHEHLKEWERARQDYGLVLSRFPSSPRVEEARYGIAFAWQKEGREDWAVSLYRKVASAADGELAVKAQLQIGRCRMKQGRYGEAAAAFLLVPLTADRFPDCSAAALCEAARALAADGQLRQARALLRRAARDYPQSRWAGVARQRLERVKRA